MSGKVFHAPFLEAHGGYELAGAWERSKKEITTHYPKAKSYASLDAVLQDDRIELVIVNTPTHTHFDYAKKALLAGKHLVVEKAFTTTVAEAEALKSLAAKQNKQLAVFQNRRWDSDFKTVQQVLNSGKLGDIVEVTFSFERFNPLLSAKLHKETPGPGAGIVNDLGPHLIDQALLLFGMPDAAFADIMITREHSRVDDYFEILLYYPKHRVRLRAGYFIKEPAPAYILHGRKGSFVKARSDKQEARLLAGEKPTQADWGIESESEYGILHYLKEGETVRDKIPTLAGNYLSFYEGIHRSIIHNEALPETAQDGINVMKIIEAAFRSTEGKTVIDL